MLARLTTLAAAGIAFLVLAGYSAVSTYLSDFGLDSHISEIGHYGYIHYGLYVLSYASFRSVAIGLLIGGLLAIGYWRYSNRVTEEPYHTIRVPSGPMSFKEYFFGLVADEHGRRTRSFLSDMLLATVIVSLFIVAALLGEQYGGMMADRTIAGYSAVGNPAVGIRQTIRLHLVAGTQLNNAINTANQAGRLNIVWQDQNSITVLVPGKWNPKSPETSMATVYSNRLIGIDSVRRFIAPKRSPHASPSTDATWPVLWIVFCIAMLALVVVFAIGDYLSVRDLTVPVMPLTNRDVDNLTLPQPYAQRAQCAIALGKDLRILRRNGRAYEVLIIRNSAFSNGSRLSWIPAYETPIKALTLFFRSRKGRDARRSEAP